MSLTFEEGGSIIFQNQDELVEFIKSSADTASTAYSMDVFWLIICAGLVFLMQVRGRRGGGGGRGGDKGRGGTRGTRGGGGGGAGVAGGRGVAG